MKINDRIGILFATGFGSGYIPIAPGTAGSLLAIPIFYGLRNIDFVIYLITLLVIFFLGIWASDIAGRYYKNADSPKIVIDEILGILITYIPLYFFEITYINLGLGFILFRLFDITKPWPAGRANRIKRPLFVMLDDIIASIYAALLLTIINIYIL